jgi:hypothetical protein
MSRTEAGEQLIWTVTDSTRMAAPQQWTCSWCHETFPSNTEHVCINSPPRLGERMARIEALLDKVCVEHADCCASLLAHACKKTSDTSTETTHPISTEPNVLKSQDK